VVLKRGHCAYARGARGRRRQPWGCRPCSNVVPCRARLHAAVFENSKRMQRLTAFRSAICRQGGVAQYALRGVVPKAPKPEAQTHQLQGS